MKGKNQNVKKYFNLLIATILVAVIFGLSRSNIFSDILGNVERVVSEFVNNFIQKKFSGGV